MGHGQRNPPPFCILGRISACQKQFLINQRVPSCLCKEAEQEQKLLFIMLMPLAALGKGEC